MEFLNSNASALHQALINAQIDFENRKKGQQFRALLFTLADVFPEDKKAIFEFFDKKDAPAIKSGGATIHRGPRSSRSTSGCSDCPGDKSAGSVSNARIGRTINKGKSSQPNKVDSVEFDSVESVLKRFDSNVTSMIAFAQAKGIKLSGSKKLESIAKKIVEHFLPE